jgi:4-hydroxy-3-methylbut-2-enyl diphosphate reductase IspH
MFETVFGDFAGVATVAVTAGASTPDFLIEAVTARLQTF